MAKVQYTRQKSNSYAKPFLNTWFETKYTWQMFNKHVSICQKVWHKNEIHMSAFWKIHL